MHRDHISYSDCGVDITFAHRVVSELHQTRSHADKIIACPNDFAGSFSIKELCQRFDDPVLVSSTDGVGTKLLVAILCDNYDSLGQDLVAMCANDIATKGAEPLFFLDYFAASNLKQVPFHKVINGMVQACDDISCALIGGESAEMPTLYADKHFDLAGFIVGAVDRTNLLGSHRVQAGDVLLGLAASGLHSNGYAMVRRIIFDNLKLKANDVLWQTERKVSTVADELLIPTRLYAKPIKDLLNATFGVHAAAHITGGGLVRNVARIMPQGLAAKMDLNQVEIPRIFNFLMEHGPVTKAEMMQTFNMGVGMVLAVEKGSSGFIETLLKASGEVVYRLGSVINEVDGKCEIAW